MKLLLLFAHAGESHDDSLSAVAHYSAPWYIALPAFILVITTIGYVTWLLSGKNLGTVLLVIAIIMLILGVTLYSISPLVSALSIVFGIVIAGFLALTSIASADK